MATVTTQPFELIGQDGGPLRGEIRTASAGEGRGAVVICHGFKGFKDWGFFPHLAQRVARAGMTAVTFNFSGSGIGEDGESFSEPDRFARATYSGDVRDVILVVNALRNGALHEELPPPPRLGVFGHSRGGGAALLYTAEHAHVSALVTWAGIGTPFRWPDDMIAEWRRTGRWDVKNARTGEVLPVYLDLLDDVTVNGLTTLDYGAAAERAGVPWLIVHGDEDEAVPVAEARELARRAGDTAELMLVEGGGHTFGARHPWAGTTPDLTLAMERTVEWFGRHLMA